MGRGIHNKYFYVVYDTTEFQLPVAVMENLVELGVFFKRSAKDVSSNLSRMRQGKIKTLLVDHKFYTVERWVKND